MNTSGQKHGLGGEAIREETLLGDVAAVAVNGSAASSEVGVPSSTEGGKKNKADEIEFATKDEMKEMREWQSTLAAEIKSLKAAKTGKGATTHAQFYQGLVDDQLVVMKADDIGIFLDLESTHTLPDSVQPSEPAVGSSEAEVQAEFERCLEMLREDSATRSAMKSVPLKNAHKWTSFASRKPDLVNQEVGGTGSMAITFFGDCKKRGSGNFADEEIGHVLDMGRVFMEKVGFYRHLLFVFLTDGKRWQFFKILRTVHGFRYEVSKVVDDATAGWKLFLALLRQDFSALGYIEPKVDGVVLTDPLGRGFSSTVYEGIYNKGEPVVVKIFAADKESSFPAEHAALQKLQDVAGVPKIRLIGKVSGATTSSHPDALILTPVAKDLRTDKCRFGELVDGRHLKKLVDIVVKAHRRNLIHRDIKPDNCFLANGKDFILIDWGSSFSVDDHPDPKLQQWEGSYGFSVTPQQQQENQWDSKTCDLVAVIRTAYVLVCKEHPPVDNEVDAIEYWDAKFRTGTVWATAIGHAVLLDYDALGRLLSTLK